MSKVAFVTDSTCGMPARFLEQYPIHVVPTVLTWAGKDYRDGVDMSSAEFYQRLASSPEMPTTAAANSAVYQAVFQKLRDEGYGVIAAFISRKVSRIYESAYFAVQEMADEQVVLIESGTGGMAVGWPLIQAAEAAAEGADLTSCADMVRQALTRTGFIAATDTLDYLLRGGRISSVQHWLGSFLNLKPIVEMKEGLLEGTERVRTWKKAQQRMIDMMAAQVNGRTPLYLAVMHANAAGDAEALLDRAMAQVDVHEGTIAEVSPSIGTHFGPGALGLNFMIGG